MKRLPARYTARHMPGYVDSGNATLLENGMWVPACPLTFWSLNPLRNLRTRLKLAVGVFTGRYDALDWEH